MKNSYLIFFIFIASLLTCVNIPVFAQQPTQEWVARYVRTPSTQVMGPFYALDKNGNSYVAGDNVINDSINILVMKYNTSGAQQWAKLYKYPGEGYFFPIGIALDTNGNAYVTAKCGQDILQNLNTVTVKLNGATGTVDWAKKYVGKSGVSSPEDIKIDRLNNIYVVGESDSSLLCIKYNIYGDTVWVRKYQPPGDFALGHACTIDDSLNIIITGERQHCVFIPPSGACFDTLLTVKYSQDGTLKWARTYFYPGNTSVNFGVKVTNDLNGNIYVAGRTRPNTGFYYYLTLKYDRDGNQQWASIYQGSGGGDDFVRSIAVDKIHNVVFVTGASVTTGNHLVCATIKYNSSTGDSIWLRRDTGIYVNSEGKDITCDTSGNAYITGYTSGSSVDILSMKFSFQGNLNWIINYNGPANGLDIAYAIKLDNSNNVYVCGASQGDYIVIKYSQPIGIHVISSETPKTFKLQQNYPNPFNPVTKIKFSVAKNSFVQLKVYNVLGQIKDVLISQNLKASEYEMSLDAANYTSGVYFYQLITDNKIIDSKKLIVLK